ncbi:MAG: Crp/Fnr family transcriptional regulator [Clostridia bacterium]|nr:Crp/Fnr family transcriptional regulator [Clostridia bacterium]
MSTPLFRGTNPQGLAAILAEERCEVRSFSAGELLLSPDTTEKSAGLLLSGKAVVHTPDPTKKTLLRFLGAEEPFGIANLFTNEPYVSVIRAHGSCRVFFISESAIRRLLEEDHAFLYHYLEFLSGRIRYLNLKIGYLTAGSPERRLALYLFSLGKKEFRLSASISALSDLLNVSRASLYRAFERLESDGVLQKNGRNFYLPDPDAMLKLYK